MKPEIIRLGIVDDHKVVLEGLVRLFSSFKGFQVVFAASSGKEALTKALADEIDILLLDVRLPDIDAATIVSQLKKEKPSIKIVCLSSFDSPYEIDELLALGISGYITKTISPEELFRAMEKISKGGFYIDKELKKTLASSANKLPHLTAREVEIVHLLAMGLSNKEIATRLNISKSTVKTHLKNIMDKLSVKNRAEIVYKAVKDGILHERFS